MMSQVMREFAAGLLAAVLAAGCASNDSAAPAPVSHSCVEPGRPAEGTGAIRWERLRNPIFSLPDAAAKDVAVRLVDGRWRLLFSHVSEDPFRFRIGISSSEDLLRWSPIELWDQPELGGVASPDVTRDPGGNYVVTYNAHTRDVEGGTKLYVRTSPDFGSWTAPVRLAPAIRPGGDEFLIDAALAHTSHGLFLAYDYQHGRFEVAWSPSGSVEGPWQTVGEADTGPFENYQFLLIDGRWHLLGTTTPVHRELLYRLAGPPDRPESWLHWELLRELRVPPEAWNSDAGDGRGFEVANAAYLCDARPLDGHWYLFYAGSTELVRFGGRGHAKVGVARSTDLVRWEVPPG